MNPDLNTSTRSVFRAGLARAHARLKPICALASLALATASLHSQSANLDELPSYKPDPSITGTVRIFGNVGQGQVVRNWQESFKKINPNLHVEYTPQFTSTAIAALYLKTADLALMGREIWHIEVQGFVRTFKHIPLGIKITSGTFHTHGDTVALGFFVHKDNPISKLSFSQIDAIFGAEHLGGAGRNFRKWGDLGLTGEWADKPIHVYGYWLDGGEAEFVRQIVLKNSYLWNSDYQQFWNRDELSDGTIMESAGQNWVTDKIIDGKVLVEAGIKMRDALAKDPYGIALNGVGFVEPRIKGLAVAVKDGGPYVAPTEENVANRSYPLTRSTFLYLDKAPGQPVDPKVKEFLKYALSREGQQDVLREGKALPLTAEVVREELKKLE